MQRQGQAWVIVDSARRGSTERLMRKNRLSYAFVADGNSGSRRLTIPPRSGGVGGCCAESFGESRVKEKVLGVEVESIQRMA